MVELSAQSPLGGMTALEVGNTRLSEVDLGVLTCLAPTKGQDAALSKALKAAHGMALPSVGRANGKEGARAIWFGHRLALLAGPAPDAGLAQFAALSDQTDAWVCVRLDGADAASVLARLTPLDMRFDAFKRGHTARTELQHMAVSLTRLSETGFLILAFRSMADTFRHDLEQAMRGVAARHGA
ncbi:MAG: sarcosine oxidase subunit gamma [Pseudomonadota bacterium]